MIFNKKLTYEQHDNEKGSYYKSSIEPLNSKDILKENIKIIKKLPKLKGVKEILYPGENKYNRYKSNLKKGIVIPKNILEDLKKFNANK